MKTVFTNHEIFHIFASGTQDNGRNSGNSMSFTGHKAYSYVSCIGQRVVRDGKTTYILATRNWSPTTSQHQSRLRQAVYNNGDILHVHTLDNWQAQVDKYTNELADLTAKLSTANKVNAPKVQVLIKELHDCIVQAATAYSLIDNCTYTAPEAPAFTTEQLKGIAATVKQAQAAALARKKQAQVLQQLSVDEACAAWRENKYTNMYKLQDVDCMLRISSDASMIETSKGAKIPTAHAVRLWPIVLRAKWVNKSYEVPIALGLYTLNSISGVGDIVVGCHQIKYAELARIAAQLSLSTDIK
jgi:hypothetical protein